MIKLWLGSSTKQFKPHLALIIVVAGLFILIFPINRTESKAITIPFLKQQIQDPAIELNESQIRQPGSAGHGLEKKSVIRPVFSYLFGLNFSYKSIDLPMQTTTPPTNEIIANGTKKYQYMLCSDGTYRYYTNEQFKDPFTGFTHKSPDACEKNGNGHMSGLSDSAPQKQAVQQPTYRPTYTAPAYTGPTNCYTQYNTYGGYFDPTSRTTCY